MKYSIVIAVATEDGDVKYVAERSGDVRPAAIRDDLGTAALAVSDAVARAAMGEDTD